MAHYIVAICRFCGKEYRLKPAAAGRRARCTECGEVFHVPAPTSNLDDTVAQWLLEDQGRETRQQESGCHDAIEDIPATATSFD